MPAWHERGGEFSRPGGALRRYDESGHAGRYPANPSTHLVYFGAMQSRRALLALLSAALPFALPLGAQAARPDTSFAATVARLSEPGGYFDTDNLVSNERSYLHVVGKLRELGVTGGAYLGVGPDQNFSYILAVRPAVALLIDIRRDNLLQHLLFKTLFLRARNRLEYLCLLFGRPAPPELGAWDERSLDDLLRYIDETPSEVGDRRLAHDVVAAALPQLGVPLDSADHAKIARIHAEFMDNGLALRLTTFNRPLRLDYPTYRDLLLETDRDGRRAGYLAREADFRYVRQLQREHRIVPVVGDLSGTQAMSAIARWLVERGLVVSAFYTSNVEQYLLRDGGLRPFARNVAALPANARSVIIRSYFLRGRPHPQQVAGYNTVQVLQTFESFLAAERRGGYADYFDLVSRDILNPER